VLEFHSLCMLACVCFVFTSRVLVMKCVNRCSHILNCIKKSVHR
jgi:hypothetical protein